MVSSVLSRRTLLQLAGAASLPLSSLPGAAWQTARAVAVSVDVPSLELDTDELADPRYAANPTNRCYFCKSEL